MRKFTSALVIVLVVFGWAMSRPVSAETPEWTIMVFMNAKNNLEGDAIQNFLQMASIGSSDKVNVVVEMGRPKNHYDESYGSWSGTLRFLVKKHAEPTEAYADGSVRDVDMGSGEALAKFVLETTQTYPAKHYLLVIWDHGQGWRFRFARTFEARRSAARGETPRVQGAVVRTGFRSISFDEDTNNLLYNSDIQSFVGSLPAQNRPEIIGFDACLMAMIETAYAIRHVAEVMVGSEELEPGAGWNYARWLGKLAENPSIDARQLAKLIVSAYQDEYGNIYRTTLSGLDLRRVDAAANAITAFSLEAKNNLGAYRADLKKARSGCSNYGMAVGIKNPVDLDCFLGGVLQNSSSTSLNSKAQAARGAIAAMVVANYASTRLQGGYGSMGLSIYFPATLADHLADPDHDGYEVQNQRKPVEFVNIPDGWATFLPLYWGTR